MQQYYVYILTNRTGTLYVGVTNNLERRMYEHKQKLVKGFAAKYNLTRLIYYEATSDPRAAIEREKQIKGWRRSKKIALIATLNSAWVDLSADWLEPEPNTGRDCGHAIAPNETGIVHRASGPDEGRTDPESSCS